MHILIVCHSSALAGAERAIAEGIVYLHSQNHLVSVVVPEAGPFLTLVAPYITAQAILAHNHWTGSASLTNWQKVKFLRGFYNAGRAIARFAKNSGADIILTNTSVIPAGALGARMAGLPHVWYLHEFVREDHALYWQYGQGLSYKLIAALSQAIVVNSQALKAKVKQFVPVDKLHVVYNAAEINWAPLVPSELPQTPTLLMAGAVHAGKNQELAIRALAEPALQALKAKLAIVGAGPDKEIARLKELANKLHVGERVSFVPFMENRRAVFAQGNVLVVASRAEAFGRVTVEAQKSGLPVVASSAGASPELIVEGETGLLFTANNAAELAQKAALLLQDVKMYSHISIQARALANTRFTITSHGQGLEKALAHALAQKNGRR